MYQPFPSHTRPPQPRLEEGMTDPRLNETVTHFGELDMDSVMEDVREMARHMRFMMIIMIVMAIIFPPFIILLLLAFWFMYSKQKQMIISKAEQTQVYITASTFVFVDAELPLDNHAITIPLENLVTATAQGSTLTVNIKPTAPEVIRTVKANTGRLNDYTTYATRSISVNHIKNASSLAYAIQGNIKY